jgi:hypothetical protein
MGYEDIELVRIHIDEMIKLGLDSQRVHRELSAREGGRRPSMEANISERKQAIGIYLLHVRDHFDCRVHQWIYAKSDCA